MIVIFVEHDIHCGYSFQKLKRLGSMVPTMVSERVKHYIHCDFSSQQLSFGKRWFNNLCTLYIKHIKEVWYVHKITKLTLSPKITIKQCLWGDLNSWERRFNNLSILSYPSHARNYYRIMLMRGFELMTFNIKSTFNYRWTKYHYILLMWRIQICIRKYKR